MFSQRHLVLANAAACLLVLSLTAVANGEPDRKGPAPGEPGTRSLGDSPPGHAPDDDPWPPPRHHQQDAQPSPHPSSHPWAADRSGPQPFGSFPIGADWSTAPPDARQPGGLTGPTPFDRPLPPPVDRFGAWPGPAPPVPPGAFDPDFGAVAREVELALRAMDELARFYTERDRFEEAERILQKRVQLPLRLVEMRMLADQVGPQKALQHFYRRTDQPDRAIDLELEQIDHQVRRMREAIDGVESEMTNLGRHRETLERRLHEAEERREQLHAEREEFHESRRAARMDDLEREAGQTKGDAERLRTEIKEVQNVLKNDELPGPRREKLQARRARLNERLRNLEQARREHSQELKRLRHEIRGQQQEQVRAHAAELRERLEHLNVEKREIRERIGAARHEMEMQIKEVEEQTERIRQELGRLTKPAARRSNSPQGDKQKARQKGTGETSKGDKAKAPKGKGTRPEAKKAKTGKPKDANAKPKKHKMAKPEAKTGAKAKANTGNQRDAKTKDRTEEGAKPKPGNDQATDV